MGRLGGVGNVGRVEMRDFGGVALLLSLLLLLLVVVVVVVIGVVVIVNDMVRGQLEVVGEM
jgi:hypothetical protein